MPVIPVTRPYYLKDATFTVDADDFAAHCSEVRFTPSQQTMTWKGIAGNVITDQSVPEWACVTGIVQDGDEDGLHRYFLDNVGQTKDVVFVPYAGGDPVYATLKIAAPEIGGTADAIATASVTHGVIGQPSYTAPVPPAGP